MPNSARIREPKQRALHLRPVRQGDLQAAVQNRTLLYRQTWLVSWPLIFWSVAFLGAGLAIHAVEMLVEVPMIFFRWNPVISRYFAIASDVPLAIGGVMAALDLFVLYPIKRAGNSVPVDPPASDRVTVVLTAYNDESSIGEAVKDFQSHPKVERVIVVSNNSNDRTFAVAQEAGAIVVNEVQPGYGRCVYRCFQEGLKFDDAELILLCEGDMTFRAQDIDKFLAYAPHATIVNGTRIVEQLRSNHTQLSTFMYYGNFFVGKLLELKHLGKGTFTDVGTTYKLCRRDALERIMAHLDPAVNLEFNAHFLDTALRQNEIMVECPITFFPRVGQSKGGNVNNRRAFMVGSRMILGLFFGFARSR